jgi:AcrR family transcriptional regulator
LLDSISDVARAAAAPRRSGGRKAAPKPLLDAVSRREHIVGSAAALFAGKGVAATTVRDIGEAAGILSGSLYYYFASKEAIVEEIVRRYLEELVAAYDGALAADREPRARLEGLIRASFTAIEQHPHACEIYQNDHKYLESLQGLADLQPLTAKVQAAWTDTIRQGVKAGAFRKDVDPKLFYRFARDAIWFTVRWYRPGKGDDVDSLTAACTTILLDGFGVP